MKWNPARQDAGSTDGRYGGDIPCARGDCTLECDPQESHVALLAETASDPKLWALGDPEPVSPEIIGDGQSHLFVGVFHEGQGEADCSPVGKPFGNAFVHDAVAARARRSLRRYPAQTNPATDPARRL